MEGTYNCPKCGIRHSVSVRHGYRYNKSGRKRLRKCKGCATKFTPDDGLLRRRLQKEHIAEAVCLQESVLLPGKVKEHMQQKHGVKVSRWMISVWCCDYFGMMERFAEIKPDINAHANNMMKGMKNRQTEGYEV